MPTTHQAFIGSLVCSFMCKWVFCTTRQAESHGCLEICMKVMCQVGRLRNIHAPLLTSVAEVPAARHSWPPLPGSSSTLWICRHQQHKRSVLPTGLALQGSEHGRCISTALKFARSASMRRSQAERIWQLTSWPMGMAERGSVLPGLMVLAGPVLIWSPGRTPCGARTYEKPLKSPPGDPAARF